MLYAICNIHQHTIQFILVKFEQVTQYTKFPTTTKNNTKQYLPIKAEASVIIMY